MANLSIELINEIDKRIELAMNSRNILCRTSAKVVSVSTTEATAEVIFYGDIKQVKYKFPYHRNYLTLKVGDTVYIESKYGDLSSGIITDKLFGMTE